MLNVTHTSSVHVHVMSIFDLSPCMCDICTTRVVLENLREKGRREKERTCDLRTMKYISFRLGCYRVSGLSRGKKKRYNISAFSYTSIFIDRNPLCTRAQKCLWYFDSYARTHTQTHAPLRAYAKKGSRRFVFFFLFVVSAKLDFRLCFVMRRGLLRILIRNVGGCGSSAFKSCNSGI